MAYRSINMQFEPDGKQLVYEEEPPAAPAPDMNEVYKNELIEHWNTIYNRLFHKMDRTTLQSLLKHIIEDAIKSRQLDIPSITGTVHSYRGDIDFVDLIDLMIMKKEGHIIQFGSSNDGGDYSIFIDKNKLEEHTGEREIKNKKRGDICKCKSKMCIVNNPAARRMFIFNIIKKDTLTGCPCDRCHLRNNRDKHILGKHNDHFNVFKKELKTCGIDVKDMDIKDPTAICSLVKKAILAMADLKELTMMHNEQMRESMDSVKLSNLFKRLADKYKRALDETFRKNVRTQEAKDKEITELRHMLKEKNRMIKKLKRLVVNQTPTDSSDSSETEETEAAEPATEPVAEPATEPVAESATEPVAEPTTEETKEQRGNKYKILETYERVKRYMIKQKISFSGLLTRNNIKDRNGYFEAFISMQLTRNEAAHPEGKPIKSDEEFLKLIVQ